MVEVDPPLGCFKLLKCPLPSSIPAPIIPKFRMWCRALYRARHALGQVSADRQALRTYRESGNDGALPVKSDLSWQLSREGQHPKHHVV